ncbi:MAG: T9SS type A sorting domain-containing protein [Bacteroidales bacterium]|jgi:hypothetical protein|nr:T9SS type A sorting domain-containing protein [Bacteroidales bacterium]
MKKIILIILSISLWITSYGQDFPPPENFHAMLDNDFIRLYWQPPQNKSLSHYNIYRSGFTNGRLIPIGSTTATEYVIPVGFGFFTCIGLSAEYSDPPGESDTVMVYIVCDDNMTLPVLFDFEHPFMYHYELVGCIGEGNDDWTLCDSIFYSPEHSAAFISDSNDSRSYLVTNYIDLESAQTPTVSFMCRIPQVQGHSDTLKLFYYHYMDWIQVADPIYSVDDWQSFSFPLDSLPQIFHFGFEATAGGGSGVYLDDILFMDQSVHISDRDFKKPLLEIRPVPATSSLILDINTNENTEFHGTLFSVDGKPVKSFSARMLMPGSHQVNLDISDLIPGMYFLTAFFTDRIITKKVVID